MEDLIVCPFSKNEKQLGTSCCSSIDLPLHVWFFFLFPTLKNNINLIYSGVWIIILLINLKYNYFYWSDYIFVVFNFDSQRLFSSQSGLFFKLSRANNLSGRFRTIYLINLFLELVRNSAFLWVQLHYINHNGALYWSALTCFNCLWANYVPWSSNMFLIHTLVDFQYSFAWMKLDKVLFYLLGF